MDPPAHEARLPDDFYEQERFVAEESFLVPSRSFISGETPAEAHSSRPRVRFDLERTTVVPLEQNRPESQVDSIEDDVSQQDDSEMDQKPESKTVPSVAPSSSETLPTIRAEERDGADKLDFKDQCRKHAAIVLSIDSPGGYKEQFEVEPEEENLPPEQVQLQGEFDHTPPGQPRQAFVPVAEAQPLPSKFYPKSERKFWTVLLLAALLLNSLLVAGLTSMMFLFVASDAEEDSSDSPETSGLLETAVDPTVSPTTSSAVLLETNDPTSSPTTNLPTQPPTYDIIDEIVPPPTFIQHTGLEIQFNISKAPSLTSSPSPAPMKAPTRRPTSRPYFRPTVKPSFPPTTIPTTTTNAAEDTDESSSDNMAVKIGVSVAVAVVAEAAICALFYWYYKRWKLHHRSVQDSAVHGKSSEGDHNEEPPSSHEDELESNNDSGDEEFVL